MSEALRDQNRVTSLITVSSVDGSTTKPATYTPITGVDPINIAVVDGSGTQITSFGGGTQYTDGGTPPANPVAPTLLWDEGGTWQTVSTAKPLPVSGTFYQATQPISGTVTANAGTNLNTSALALETGGNLATIAGDTTSIDGKLPALGQALAAASVPVVLTADQLTTLTPPAAIIGFATSAKQPALGTAGTASTDVITVQGIASMTALKVDGSAVTQPVSGTFYQATQPVSLASVPSHAVTNTGTFAVQADTELPAAEALSDTIANPTAPAVGAFLMGWDSAAGNWERLKTDTGGILSVQSYLYGTDDNGTTWRRVKTDSAGAVSLAAGTNAIGKLAANSGVDIGDVDVTSVPRSLSGPGQPGTAVDSYAHAAISASANTADQSVVAAPGANKQIWVYGITYVVGTAAGSVSFQDEDNTAITGVMPHALNSGMAVPPSGNFSMPIWKVATNKALEVDTVTCDIKGWIDYAIVSV